MSLSSRVYTIAGALAGTSITCGALVFATEETWHAIALCSLSIVSGLSATTLFVLEHFKQWRLVAMCVFLFLGGSSRVLEQGAKPNAASLLGVLVLLVMRDMNASHDKVMRHLELRGGEHVVEIGCADGHFTAAIASALGGLPDKESANVVGVDVSESAVQLANALLASVKASVPAGAVVARVGTPEGRVPVDEGTVDIVVHCHCVYFWPDLAAGLAEVKRVLKPGGRHILVMAPQPTLEKNAAVKDSPFLNFSHEKVEQACRDAGFHDLTRLGHVLMPGSLVLRMLK